VVAGAICNFATKLKFYFGIDDALDLLAEHAIGGVVGLLFNGFFATNSIIALDGVNVSIPGGFLDSNWKQLYIQFAYVCATVAYTFVVSAAIAKGLDLIPGLHLRSDEEGESLGMDEVEIGEFANDYIEVRRDFMDWTPSPGGMQDEKESNATTETHVTVGDRHGRPDVGPHAHSQTNGYANPDQFRANLPAIDKNEKGVGGDRHAAPETT